MFLAVLAWRLALPVLRGMLWVARLAAWLWAFMAYAVDGSTTPALIVLAAEFAWQVARGVCRGLRASRARLADTVPA